ncbi:hypothetical protein D3C73_1289760 [compost metagenome]
MNLDAQVTIGPEPHGARGGARGDVPIVRERGLGDHNLVHRPSEVTPAHLVRGWEGGANVLLEGRHIRTGLLDNSYDLAYAFLVLLPPPFDQAFDVLHFGLIVLGLYLRDLMQVGRLNLCGSIRV